MSTDGLTQICEDTLAECLDALDEIVARMERFPPALVALALRLHVEELLQMLIERRLVTRGEVRVFLQELEHNTLPEL
jgi:hypothetical protein